MKIRLEDKVFTLVFALAICVSTFTTKQHFVLDGIVRIILAETVYQIVKYYYRGKEIPEPVVS